MKTGSENSQDFYNGLTTNCPSCGAEHSLNYHMKDLELDELTGETETVEGLVCSECDDIFMSPDEGARFLNIKARRDGSKFYYGVHDGEIQEVKLQ